MLKIIELAFLSPVADRKVSRFVVLVGAGLQMRALGITIADILEALSTDRSNAVIGLVAAVPGAYGKFTGLSIGSKRGRASMYSGISIPAK